MREHGGAPLLGVDGVALICHGGIERDGDQNAVFVADRFAQMGLRKELTEAVARHNALWDAGRAAGRGGHLLMRSRIVGTGRAVPPKKLTNDDLSKMVDTSDSWIVERTGIRERHILDPSLAASDLATEAGAEGVPRGRCRSGRGRLHHRRHGDAATCPLPATATFVQKKMGARLGGCAFDLSAACAGFLYGMSIADGFIRTGQFKRVLVIGVEVLSRIVDWTDRNTCVLFGDGAGAVLVTADDGWRRGLLSTHLFADGSQHRHPRSPAAGAASR